MKKKLIAIIPFMIILLFFLCFFLIQHYYQNHVHIKSEMITAKSYLQKYKDVEYGELEILKNPIITKGGIYHVSGEHGCITVNTRDNVQLILDSAHIACETGPAIYVEDSGVLNIHTVVNSTIEATSTLDLRSAIYSKDSIYFSGKGILTVQSNYDAIVSKDNILIESGSYILNADGDGIQGTDNVYILNGNITIHANQNGIQTSNNKNPSKGNIVIDNGDFIIYSNGDAIDAIANVIIHQGHFQIQCEGNANTTSSKAIKGRKLIQIQNGNFSITSTDDSIHSDQNILILGGFYQIHSSDDAIHADGILQVKGGEMEITAKEGLESTTMMIEDGTFQITASENGMTVGKKHPKDVVSLTILGGDISIKTGSGVTCALDSNQSLTISGGTIRLQSETPFCYSGKATYTGGTIIINDVEVNQILEVESKERTPMENLPDMPTPTPPQNNNPR